MSKSQPPKSQRVSGTGKSVKLTITKSKPALPKAQVDKRQQKQKKTKENKKSKVLRKNEDKIIKKKKKVVKSKIETNIPTRKQTTISVGTNSSRSPKITKVTGGFREYNIKVKGIQLHVGQWLGKEPIVICIHGMTANFKSFSLLAERLQEKGCHVLAYDLRGRGRSDKPSGTLNLDVHVEDLLGILEAVNANRVILMGHSLGAFIALKFASKYPERVLGLVLLDGGARLSLSRRLKSLALVRQSARRLKQRFSGPQEYLKQVYASPLLKRPNSRSDEFLLYEIEMKEDGSWGTATPYESIEAELNGMGASLSYSKIFFRFLKSPFSFLSQALRNRSFPPGSIRAPALILRAGHYNIQPNDDFLPLSAAKKLANELNGAAVHTLENCNHFEMLFLEDPVRDKLITDFIQQINN